MDSSKKKLEPLIAGFIYTALCLLFYWEIFFQIHWLGEDFFTQNFPNRVFAGEEIRRGHFPLWNPFLFSGMPFLADIQTGVLYPFNFLLSPFFINNIASFTLYEYQVVLHSALAGFFAYIFIRELSLDFLSALLGGTIFAFCGLFINHVQHTNFIHSAIWLPAIFYCCLRGIRDRSLWILGCPIGLSISLFG